MTADDIYPCTIWSGPDGIWQAVPDNYWELSDLIEYPEHGRGATPNEALADLAHQLQEAKK